MADPQIQVLIFAAREDSADGWGRAKILESELVASGISDVVFINRMAANLEFLTLVAKHKIVKSPAVVVLKKGKPFARYVGVPNQADVLQWIKSASRERGEKQ